MNKIVLIGTSQVSPPRPRPGLLKGHVAFLFSGVNDILSPRPSQAALSARWFYLKCVLFASWPHRDDHHLTRRQPERPEKYKKYVFQNDHYQITKGFFFFNTSQESRVSRGRGSKTKYVKGLRGRRRKQKLGTLVGKRGRTGWQVEG